MTPAKFRVFPENKTLFFTVFVWPSLKSMRTANPGNSHAYGLCRSALIIKINLNGTERSIPKLGEIHLCQSKLTIGIISHECTHATIAWACRTRLKLNLDHPRDYEGEYLASDSEERFCRVLGELVRQIVSKCHELKLY